RLPRRRRAPDPRRQHDGLRAAERRSAGHEGNELRPRGRRGRDPGGLRGVGLHPLRRMRVGVPGQAAAAGARRRGGRARLRGSRHARARRLHRVRLLRRRLPEPHRADRALPRREAGVRAARPAAGALVGGRGTAQAPRPPPRGDRRGQPRRTGGAQGECARRRRGGAAPRDPGGRRAREAAQARQHRAVNEDPTPSSARAAPRRFETTAPPHAKPVSSVPRIMRRVLYALAPAAAGYTWFFGYGLIINFVIAAVAAVATEAAILLLRRRPVKRALLDGSAVVTAALLAFALPPLLPWWIPALGGFVAIALAKQLYGGLGKNLFNPAMVAYVLLLASFPILMTQWLPPRMGDIDYQRLGFVDQLRYSLFVELPP